MKVRVEGYFIRIVNKGNGRTGGGYFNKIFEDPASLAEWFIRAGTENVIIVQGVVDMKKATEHARGSDVGIIPDLHH